ncbi:MAG TPA: hypothetical protein VM389_00500 [Phycisphaerae bacterium]|nr:hypothetical protein [Phycisphaerae bacterium]
MVLETENLFEARTGGGRILCRYECGIIQRMTDTTAPGFPGPRKGSRG